METFEGFKGVESQIYDIVVHGRNQEIDGSRLHQDYFLNGLEKASDTLTRMIMKESISKQATHSDENETEAFACSIMDTVLVSEIELQQLIEAQEQDEVCNN